MSTVRLDIAGMTCTSCAARVEKKLNRLDGVEATVNYATEHASVTAAPGVTVDELVATVESAGYSARPAHHGHEHDHGPDDEASIATLRRRVLIATALAVPVVALSMIDPLRFRGWQWVALVLATPVVSWAAWPFHRATWTNLRHGATTMDTLISMGVLAAYGWSLSLIHI